MTLTQGQRTYLLKRNVVRGMIYMFPQWGFYVYSADGSDRSHMDTNPFTRSLGNEMFYVKEILDNGLVRGNFYHRPHKQDFYLDKSDLEYRGIFNSLFDKTLIPFFMVYNLFSEKEI